jgi:hypothetical protein
VSKTSGGALALAAFAVAAAPIAAAAAAPTADGHRHDNVVAECRAPAESICYFNILLYRGGMRTLKVRGGEKLDVRDVEEGKDIFMVTIDEPAPTNFAICRAAIQDSHPCLWDYVKSSITNVGGFGDTGGLIGSPK